MSDLHRLAFTVPVTLRLGVIKGRHQPCLHGCSLIVGEHFGAVIEGPSRERVFDQARRFLRVHARGHGAMTIAATLRSPPPARGIDSWSIVIGAEIAFAPTSIPPDIREPPPRQTIFSAG